MSDNNQHSFRKSLNIIDSSAIVIGSMIGSGIFIVSADMSRTLGSPGWLLVAWLITGFMTIMAVTIMIILLIYKPKFTWPGLVIVLLGIPVYYIWTRINKKV